MPDITIYLTDDTTRNYMDIVSIKFVGIYTVLVDSNGVEKCIQTNGMKDIHFK